MCPSYLATRDEKDSTRGRARVLQELANGTLVSGWDAPEVAESLDLCLSCKGCSSDCPAGIDMATYKAEALYQRYRRRLRPAVALLTGLAAPLGGPGEPGTVAGRAGERVAAPRAGRRARQAPRRHRPPPRPAAVRGGELPPVVRRAPGAAGAAGGDGCRGRAAPGAAALAGGAAAGARKPVYLWVDTFTNAFSPQVGRAAVAVLEAAGYEVRITGSNVCCGLTWISTGQLDGARRQLRRTLRALAPALDAGIPVVGLEPSCTAALRRDAGELLPGDRRAAALSGAVRTLAELLRSTEGWNPPDLSDISGSNAAVAQPHCHQHAVLGWEADAALLRARGRDRQRGRRLLRPRGQLRRGARPLRRLCRGRRDRAPARGAGGGRRRDGPGRRLLLPHPARPAGRRPRHAPGRAPGVPPHSDNSKKPPANRLRSRPMRSLRPAIAGEHTAELGRGP